VTAITRFNRWFNVSGHWIYPSREAAAKVWIERGIECLDDAPQWTTVEQVVGNDNSTKEN
jgi:hypothetical protein